MRPKLLDDARKSRDEYWNGLTPEQQIQAAQRHAELIAELRRSARRALRSAQPEPEEPLKERDQLP